MGVRSGNAGPAVTRYTYAGTPTNELVAAVPAGQSMYITYLHVSAGAQAEWILFHTTNSTANAVALGSLPLDGNFSRTAEMQPIKVGDNLTVKHTSDAAVKITLEYFIGAA